MAEGFARHYGADVLVAASSGVSPLTKALKETAEIMEEKNVDISRHVPRYFTPLETPRFDIVVNMSGMPLPGIAPRELLEWDVSDPYCRGKEAYRATRDDIENRVMRLILRLRRHAAA